MKKQKSDALEQGLTILEFIRHPQLLNDQSNTKVQDLMLKAVYGLDLDDAEQELFRAFTGRDYVACEQREATIIAGRRSGKTSRIGARIALYEALRDHHIPRGERAYVLLIAAFVDQARLAFDYICRDIRSSPVLLAKVRKFRKNEIVLRNGVTIICCPCSSVSIRGKNVITAVCDEVCFWRNEETAAHSDVEVLAALRPSLITFPKSKLIKISTPHAKRGVVWDEFRRRGELPYAVWQVSTPDMNPNVSREMLEHERERNLEEYKREYSAEFVENVVSWIDSEVLDPCIVPGRTELPRVNNGTYVAAVDPAFKQSDFALAIAHRTNEGLIVLDRVDRWTGTTKTPLAFGRVCREVADILQRYQIDHLQGDQYAAPAIQDEFLKLGISYREITFGRHTRPQIFNNLKHLLTQRTMELLDRNELLQQLRALEELRAHDGSIDVRPGYGKDDLACVLALCAFELSQNRPVRGSIAMGRASRPWDGRVSSITGMRGGYLVAETCSQYPGCFEPGHRCECHE